MSGVVVGEQAARDYPVGRMMLPTAAPPPGEVKDEPPVRWAAGWALGAAVSLLMLAPTLRPGYVLRYDMVFVPDPAVNAHSLGLDGSVPRAVPTDFLVAVLSHALPADWVQKLLLLAAPLIAVLGMWRLLRSAGLLGQVAGALAFSWNVYVFGRLGLGHWSLLLGVAVLPWILGEALDIRSGRPRAQLRLLGWLGVAAASTPTTGVLGLAVALAVLLPSGRLRGPASGTHPTAVTLGAGILFMAPWWLPGLLAAGRGASDPAGVAAFAARADTPLGSVGSVLTFGGTWNAAVAPPGRDSWLAALAAMVVLAVAALGLRAVVRAWGRGPVVGLAVLAAACVVLAVATVLPGGSAALHHLVVDVPGAGLLRDGQKLVAPWLLLVSVCFGYGVARAARSRSLGPAAATTAVALAVLPVAMLPGLAWGEWGRLSPVAYPQDYAAVQHVLADANAPGDVLVLPWHLYRAWSWNGMTATLDPWSRILDRNVLARDDLELADRVVRGEDPRVPLVSAALAADGPLLPTLQRLGVGFVIVDRDTAGGPVQPMALDGLTRVFAGSNLDLYVVDSAGAPDRTSHVPVIVTADVLALTTWLAVVVALLVPRGRRLLQSRRRRDGGSR
jgi:hypothetical protein